MIKFITVWVLTVSYVNINYDNRSGGAMSYQLQYETKAECLKQVPLHSEQSKSLSWGRVEVTNAHKRARCDMSKVVVAVK